MRATTSLLLAFLGACAAAPRAVPAWSPSAVYDLDTHAMVPIVFKATHAQHYRVAVIDPKEGHSRFVMMPTTGGGSPLIVHLNEQSYHTDRFSTCVGSCATAVEVTSLPGNDASARELLDAIGEQARADRAVR